jgi:exodeoxyribonuclease V alpha subunit
MSLNDLRSQGLLELLDLEMARALSRMGGPADPDVELAIALTSRSVRRGHTAFPISLRANEIWPAQSALGEQLPSAARWVDALQRSPLTENGPLVLDDAGRLYFRRYWQFERDIADQLRARSTPRGRASDASWLEATLDRLFPGAPDSPQRNAARNALRNEVSLLCGGPGTGKTTTVAAIVALLIEDRLNNGADAPKVMLLAPTGKAAARLGEAVQHAKARIDAPTSVLERIPETASTIQRALGMRRDGVRFRRSADLPLEANIIVVDEASMIDLVLMRQLLDATQEGATLLIVGDPDQLTSVEAGSVLRDLVTADAETCWGGGVTELTKTYRYDEKQPLGQLIAAIRSGEPATVDALLDREDADDVDWSSLDGLPAELDLAAEYWSKAVSAADAEEHFRLRSRYVILTPFRRGPIGTYALGASIQARLSAAHDPSPRVTPIIIEENSHELRVYNGDFAMLIDGEPAMAIVQSEAERFRELAEARLPRYSDAFALSVHKAQGSEFDEVLLVLPEEDAPLLTRELLYTAVSRARKRVRIVGPKQVVAAALERRAQRHSGLVDAIGAS